MSDPGDPVARRYRELAREEPPSALDARILAAARENRGLAPEPARDSSRVTGARPQWMMPVAVAAVLVLGIGVSLRMQLEEPGIETSVPSTAASEYSLPVEPPPQPQSAPAREAPQAPRADAPAKPTARATAPSSPSPLRKERAAPPVAAPVEEAQRNAAAESAPRPFPDAPAAQAAPAPALPPAPAPVPHAAPAPAPAPAAAAPVPSAKALGTAQAPAPATAPVTTLSAAAPAPRAKLEAGVAADAASGAREMRREAAEAHPEPLRELERIAGLRAAGNHAEADRALEHFRKRHPDFRIPEALWERVRPR